MKSTPTRTRTLAFMPTVRMTQVDVTRLEMGPPRTTSKPLVPLQSPTRPPPVKPTQSREDRYSMAALPEPERRVLSLVERCYLGVLGRPSDEIGRQYWRSVALDLQRSGMSFEAVKAELESLFKESGEHRGLGALVESVYQLERGRPSDSAGRSHWVAWAQSLRDEGLSDAQIRARVVAEFAKAPDAPSAPRTPTDRLAWVWARGAYTILDARTADLLRLYLSVVLEPGKTTNPRFLLDSLGRELLRTGVDPEAFVASYFVATAPEGLENVVGGPQCPNKDGLIRKLITDGCVDLVYQGCNGHDGLGQLLHVISARNPTNGVVLGGMYVVGSGQWP